MIDSDRISISVVPAKALGHAHIPLCDVREIVSALGLCVLRDALSRALLRMRRYVRAITKRPHPEERPSAASRRTHHADARASRCVHALVLSRGRRTNWMELKRSRSRRSELYAR